MEIEQKNQNNNNFEDVMELFEIDYVYENKPIKRTIDEPNAKDKQSLLENLKSKILNISDCELKKNSKQIVFNDGNPMSPIMIVGEGPGQKEDEMGKPFVGDAGVLLNRMLEAINIKRPNVYITNVVNYRPPNNRKPEPSEINKYSVFLREHINIIDPKIRTKHHPLCDDMVDWVCQLDDMNFLGQIGMRMMQRMKTLKEEDKNDFYDSIFIEPIWTFRKGLNRMKCPSTFSEYSYSRDLFL